MKLIVFGAPFLIAGLVSTSALALDSNADHVLIQNRQPAQNSQMNFSDDDAAAAAKKKKKKSKTPTKKTAAIRSTPAKSAPRTAYTRPAYNKPLPSQPPRKLLPAAISSPVTLAERRMQQQPLTAPMARANTASVANKRLYAQNSATTLAPATATDANSFTGLTLPTSSAPVMKTKVAAPEDATKKNPFGFKYLDISAEYINAAEAPNSATVYGSPTDHEVQAWDRFYVYYNMNNDISLGIMGQLFHTWFGDPSRAQDANPATPQTPTNASLNQPYAAFIGDTELYLKDTKIAQLGGWKLEGILGWYLPTSQVSQQSGQIGESDTGLSIGTSWGPIDFKYTEKLWYFFQSYQTSTLVDSSGQPLRNTQYGVWSLADGTWNITSKFSFDLTAGFMNQALYADENGERPQVLNDYIIVDPELDYEFNKHFTLGLGLWEEYDMRNASEIGTNPTINGQPGTPIYVAQYTPFAAWNGGTQIYLTGTIKF